MDFSTGQTLPLIMPRAFDPGAAHGPAGDVKRVLQAVCYALTKCRYGVTALNMPQNPLVTLLSLMNMPP